MDINPPLVANLHAL